MLGNLGKICSKVVFYRLSIGTLRKRRIVSSGMIRRVALVTTEVSEEISTSFIRVTKIGELGTTLSCN
jgi:hypothetical protein